MLFFLSSSLPSFLLAHTFLCLKTQVTWHHLGDAFPHCSRHNYIQFCCNDYFENVNTKTVDMKEQFEIVYVQFPPWETWGECKRQCQLNLNWVGIHEMHPYAHLKHATSVRRVRSHIHLHLLQPALGFQLTVLPLPPVTQLQLFQGQSKLQILR